MIRVMARYLVIAHTLTTKQHTEMRLLVLHPFNTPKQTKNKTPIAYCPSLSFPHCLMLEAVLLDFRSNL